jgi:hypothetical protein
VGTSTVNISGVVYDGALTTPGSIQFNVGNSNPTPCNLSATTITTATTTTLAVPSSPQAIGAFINSNATVGTITVGGQSWALIGAGFIPIPSSETTLVIVTGAGFTGTVEVIFV